ncbi:MAG: hypothetical protein RMJ35_01880 [Phycisphaerales bacterium]|nr:hypothetical protein [Phycisphaerales bacterium]
MIHQALETLEPRQMLLAGTLDPAFADAGRLVADLSPPLVPRAVAVQPDGKILLAAQTTATDPLTQRDFYLLRLQVDGSSDTAFGLRRIDFGEGDSVADLLVQPDGTILATGRTLRNGVELAVVTRLQPDGSPDPTFGTGGIRVLQDHPGIGPARVIASQPDGRLLLGCTNAVVRLNSDGSSDRTFSNDGVAELVADGRSGTVSSLAVRTDGTIVASQFVSGFRDEIGVFRLRPDGSLDKTFGGDGRVYLTGPSEAQLLPLSDRRLLVASIGGRLDNVQLRRLNHDGGLDGTFAASGSARLPIPGPNPVLRNLLVSADGRFLVAGFCGGQTINQIDAFVARVLPDGSPDPTFATDAVARVDLFAGDRLADAAVAPDGKIVFTAFSQRQNPDDTFESRTTVARLIGTSTAPSVRISGSGTLLVQGSELPETIEITDAPGARVRASINGISTTFPARNVRRVAVLAGGGDDTIRLLSTAGASSDLAGQSGSDRIFGNGRDNLLRGGSGDDTLFGFGGEDTLLGDADDDVLDGGSGNDSLDGGSGDDRLFGFGGRDTLIGSDGSDTLLGGSDVDEILE